MWSLIKQKEIPPFCGMLRHAGRQVQAAGHGIDTPADAANRS
jgi:hypothetical protein